jgi:diguanylate cyclase (GGDEF)-like protein/PAS domain S-box-containing protein
MQRQARLVSAARSQANASVSARAKLLIVDDEPLMLSSLAELLRLRGYQVSTVSTGREAIDLVTANKGYDLMLLDLNMPDMHGFGVAEHAERFAPGMAVVVVSGDTTADAAIGAMRKGVHDFIRKPYEPEELLRTVADVLEKSKRDQARRENSELVDKSERWHRFLVHHSPDIIYTLDREGRFSFVNDRALAQLGFARGELLGTHFSEFIVEQDLERAKFVFNERRTGKRAAHDMELRLKIKPSVIDADALEGFITIELSACGIYDSGACGGTGQFRGTYGVARNIGERKRAEETIYHHAYHDVLTGLPNRLLFRDRLSLAIAQAKRSGHMLAVMFLDLDRFKAVNDGSGHAVGDQLLQAVAARVSKCIREGDTLARLGGDEFTLLLPHIAGREAAENAARKILSVISQPFPIDGQEHHSGMSIGIAVYPDDGDNMDALVRNADVAMYDVKARGRNNYVFFSEARQAARSSRASLGGELRKAVARNQLELHYQPQVDSTTGRITALEALLRWNHPVHGQLPPEEFITLAQEAGATASISEWVIRTACTQIKEWRDHGVAPVRLGINLTPEQIEQHDFMAKFTQLLQQAKVDASWFEIEITESALLRNVDATQARLRQLAALGVQIAIDDFGMGYSALSYLRTLPIHAIKIDRSFVADIDPDEENSIVAAILLIAKGLKLRLVAEGVETREQLEFLRANGCGQCQGYLFSRPLSAEEATRLLVRGDPLLPR